VFGSTEEIEKLLYSYNI